MLRVVGRGLLAGDAQQLESPHLEAAAFEPAYDLCDQTPAHGVGFDHHKSALDLSHAYASALLSSMTARTVSRAPVRVAWAAES